MNSTTHSFTAADLLSNGFRDAVVLVIGGRGGIGSEVVRQAEALGARIIIGSSSVAQDPSNCGSLEGSGRAIVRCDLSSPRSVREFADTLAKITDRIDVLVNTAGSSVQVPLKRLDLLDDTLIDEVFETNAQGLLRLIRDCVPLMKAGCDPVIVNVGSVAARTGVGSNLAYVGAKAAMDAVSVGLAKALAPQIRVVTVAPSALDTGFVRGRGADFIEKTIASTPLARLASVEEVASAIICAARVLTATTGTVIYVDGGRHL